MDEDNPELKMVKSMLRAVLMSCKEGVPAETLFRDYREVVGDIMPYKKFGFSSMEDFIMAMPDVVRVARRGPDYICHAIADESTAHIQKLVSKQRSKKPKRPVRRPRGGGAGAHFLASRGRGARTGGPPRAAWAPTQARFVPPDRRGMPSVMTSQRQMTPVTIRIGNTSSGTRTIQLGSNRMLNKALQEANSPKSYQAYDKSAKYNAPARFETPPRFRRKLDPQHSPPSSQQASAPYKRSPPKQEFATITDGDKYMAQLKTYLASINHPVNFDTSVGAGGYVSTIMINRVTYGSEDVYATAVEAEQAVAKNALSRIEVKKSSADYNPVMNWAEEQNSSVPSAMAIPAEKLRDIKAKVKQILLSKKNGLWLSVMPFQYKKEFNEDAPDNLLELIKSWKDIAKVEIVANTDREIVYPVEDDKNKHLVIPREPLITSCDEKVVVYMTFIHNLGYFCVQRDDSIIDDITEQLQVYCKSMSSPDPSTMEKGQFCAGIYSGDNNWTRAQILNVRDDRRVQLMFVDYGNLEEVSVERVRWLSPELAHYPTQAIICSLYGVEPLEGETEWSTKSLTVFAELVKEEAMEAIPKRLYDDFVEVDLYLKTDPSESIADKLVKAGVVKSIREKIESLGKMEPDAITLPEDKQWDVYITYINSSTNSVMVRLVGEEYSDTLDGYQAKLQDAFRNTNSEAPIIEGMTYVALDDLLYHRVRLMSTEGKKVKCYFLDHGDTDDLLPEQLQPLDPKVNRLLPYQAIEVSLYGLEEVATNTTALERLCELALTKTCVAEVVEREGVPSVILFDTSEEVDININDRILEAIEADGGGIDSSGSSSSTPQRVLSPAPSDPHRVISPVPSDPKLSSSKMSEFSTSITPNADKVHIVSDKHSTPVLRDSDLSVSRLQNLSLSESSIHTDSPVQQKPAQYLPPTPTESSPPVFETRFGLDRTPEVSEICDKKDSDSQSHSLPLYKLDLLTDIPEIRREETNVKRKSFKTMMPYTTPAVGEYFEVHINLIHDPSNFNCLPYEELNNLTGLFAAMKDYYDDKPPFKMTKADITIGNWYAGWRDQLWYRVRVTQFATEELLSVYLIDHGEYSVMGLEEIQPLYKQFYALPMMAIHARLGGIKPVGGSWSEAAKYKFIELAKEKDLIGLILERDQNKNSLVLRLIDTSNDTDLCIDEVLIQMGYAKLIET